MKVVVFSDKHKETKHVCFNCSHLDIGVSDCWFCGKDGHHIGNAYILFHGINCKDFDEDDPKTKCTPLEQELFDALKHATHTLCVSLCASCLPKGAETGLVTFIQNGCPRGSKGCDAAKWWELIRKVLNK